MIEISWFGSSSTDLVNIASYFQWLIATIMTTEESNKMLRGVCTLYEGEGKVFSLIMCDDDREQKRLYDIIQQPPGEYEGKYIAKIVNGEPELVQEGTSGSDVESPETDDDCDAA